MGLDWNPIGKPKPGDEAEFEHILDRLMMIGPGGRLPASAGGSFGRIFREIVSRPRRGKTIERLRARMREIEITPYETLGAPRVGHDPAADKWAEAQYADRQDADLSLAAFLDRLRGYRVIDLVPECDGVPPYSNGSFGSDCDAFSFRAEFLFDCEDMLGPELAGEAYEHHTAPGLADFGRRLQNRAIAYAGQNAIAWVLERRDPPDEFEGPPAQAHIVMSAARWCLF